MPTLKQITCNVEWSSSNVPLHEYQTIYADGFVETYVAVPPIPTQFSIHLRSHGYIAPGLAMFVYMDGEYQCNRNRSNLKTPSEARTWRQTEVDFKVRQKEEVLPDGSFSGKQWKFELLKTGESKKTPEAWKTNISAESSHQIVPAKRLAPHDAQYVGTIEVVVLRCYPTQPSTNIIPSTSLAESVPFVRPLEPSSPLSGDTHTSSPSSSDVESTSSESVASLMADMFDGTADYPGGPSRSVQPHRSYIGSSPGKADTRPSGNLPSAPTRYDQFYDTPDPQKSRTRVAPDGRGRDHDNDRGQNTSHNSARHGNHEHHKNTSESQNQASRNLPGAKAQRNHNGSDSNDRFSTSNRSRNSRAGSVAARSSPNVAWVQSQGSPAQAAPAVVINVSHGTPQPAVSSSLANTQALNIDSAKVHTWHDPSQDDKIDEYLGGTNRSPEGSNGSKASKRSNNSGTWPVQDYANDHPQENSIEQANASWHNEISHEESNENQWPTVESTTNPEGGHETSAYHDDSQTWENNVVGSQPLESSSMEVQNNSNGCSNENSYVSNHTNRDADTRNRQPPPQNSSHWAQPAYSMEGKPAYTVGSAQPKGTGIEWSGRVENSGSVKPFISHGDSNELRLSVHPSSPGQGAQQHSSRSSHKSAYSKHTCVHDAPNPQTPWATNHEAPGDVAPQSWSDRAVEPNNHGLEPPQPAPSQIYGSILPMPIDPRPRPYWSKWGQPRRVGNLSKAVVPHVEPAEPLHYVPLEVAQRNKMSHQVYVGQPAEYVHKSASPKYMDDFSRPYAVFVFKYRSRAILEQILNTTLIEPEAQEKERLQDLSREELIEQLLKAKAYKNAALSGSQSSHTAKPEETSNFNRDAEAPNQSFPNQHPPNQAIQSYDNASTNPEHHWGRHTPILNTAAPHPEVKVASWLGSGSGGGSGGGNHKHGGAKNGSAYNGSGGGLGPGNRGTQDHVPGEWNRFEGAGAWAENDGQHAVQQTSGEAWNDNENENGDGNEEGEVERKW